MKDCQVVDLLISHSQLIVRSRAYDEASSQWGDGNIAQGALLYPDYVIFDPLPDDAFGANVYLSVTEQFIPDESSQRSIVVPFQITDKEKLEVASAMEKCSLELNLSERLYHLYYEICEGDEIFYKFTFVPADIAIIAHYLHDDPWGGTKNAVLSGGKI